MYQEHIAVSATLDASAEGGKARAPNDKLRAET
jgi:hypothetical protein